MQRQLTIQNLPTRYEGLSKLLGDQATTTLLPLENDLNFLKRLLKRSRSANQGKLQFLCANPGTGKTSFVAGLEIFLGDEIGEVKTLPLEYEMPYSEIPQYIANIPPQPDRRFTVISFDGREALSLDESTHRNMLVELNALLRKRPDMVILWPVTRPDFAEEITEIMRQVGGRSSLGSDPTYSFHGLQEKHLIPALEKLLSVANWTLEDAGVEQSEAEEIASRSYNMGDFLDQLQEIISERFDIEDMGRDIPSLLFVVSSGNSKIREVCRNLRRADSFYLEASRLTMYTRRSNIAEWWANRNSEARTSLAHSIAMFNAQLTTMSPASVVHAVANGKDSELRELTENVSSNRGAATNVIRSSELYKYITGGAIDVTQTGTPGKQTLSSYAKIQEKSETHHKSLNEILLTSITDRVDNLKITGIEKPLVPGLHSDAVIEISEEEYSLEFHHKAANESTENKIAIYILTKIKEYAINYGLAKR